MHRLAFQIIHPERRTTSVVFASPHSGRDYPRSFLRQSALNEHAIRSSEDAFVDELFETAPVHGAPLLCASVPRAYIDLNRSEDELDPALIEGVRKAGHNPRVASGLGVVPRVVANGQAIYNGKIPRAEADRRIETYWRPYHTALGLQLQEAQRQFGQAILIDCHSMPHEAMDSVARSGIRRPDVVLGDRFGAAAGEQIVDRIEEAFYQAGLVVTRNTPFAGAYVTQHYGRPSKGQHAVQIEIDRSLYMDERTVRPNSRFRSFKKLLDGVVGEIAAIGRPVEQPLAAE
ncbi:N-formylglutamate amidohydrolase [Roseovarius indicus]|uniref:N-formylglutamate amidohydrolase n=1 Tax=Roseovarius indicus TaxID=540747 RepID=A0A0T5P2R5_9RHOB|nr:N-formylglutamate amidohydrolase [Roseovarius indicus]KRS15348.1 N-formylglutamate amidohydrolase [Roseovarius indicus]OAN98890.1 N-formylglutamate amidohydrolase [Roseovarius indicus]QEW28682.1 N-formylglutamate deformylase [Roseovarius indicus]SFE69007.1 N-formylglutamate amidohydrolase [Roseovarius indicus]